MLIKLDNGKTFESERVVNFKKTLGQWKLKLNNGYTAEFSEEEYPWLMTIIGTMIEIDKEFALNVNCITLFEEKLLPQTGYLIAWDGEPPIEVSKETGDDLIQYIIESGFKTHLTLCDRKDELVEKGVQPNYKKLI